MPVLADQLEPVYIIFVWDIGCSLDDLLGTMDYSVVAAFFFKFMLDDLKIFGERFLSCNGIFLVWDVREYSTIREYSTVWEDRRLVECVFEQRRVYPTINSDSQKVFISQFEVSCWNQKRATKNTLLSTSLSLFLSLPLSLSLSLSLLINRILKNYWWTNTQSKTEIPCVWTSQEKYRASRKKSGACLVLWSLFAEKTGEELGCALCVSLATLCKTLTQYSSPKRLSVTHTSDHNSHSHSSPRLLQYRNSTVDSKYNSF